MTPIHAQPNGMHPIEYKDDLEAAKAWVAEDPYAAADVFASVEVMAWRKAIG